MRPDCILIGYNETPFEEYESLLRHYGEDSGAYRDLQFSFVRLGEQRLDYVRLLNHVYAQTGNGNQAGAGPPPEFKACDIPNLAAAYLTHYLRKRDLQVEWINLFQYEKQRLIELLRQEPLCVALTTTFYVINLPVNEMVTFIRKHNPRVRIVIGGPLVANHARNYQGEAFQAAMADLGADIYVIDSQGELTLSRIVECLKAGGDLASVPNIAYFENQTLRTTGNELENNSLDENFIDWRRLAIRDLGPTLQTRTARSCAFKCAFCNYPTRAGTLTLAGLDTIEAELDSMRSLGYVKNVVFIDDTFNVPLPRFKDICRLMIRKNYGFNWFSYFRCSNSDVEAFDLMAQSGCRGVFLGIESGSPRILKNMNKAATVERYAEGIKQLRGHGILSFASLIVGFPGENAESVMETEEFIRNNRPDYYRAQMWYCERGTPIDHRREEFGITGDGFVWSHRSMDHLEAMDQIARMFLSIRESVWLPQWSFDFWTIPYLLGRGLGFEHFRALMTEAHELLRLEIADIDAGDREALQKTHLERMVEAARRSLPVA